ncbi:MAG: hypothetical protein A2846_03540 [Candidatus Doudnabacteria bacterium RIFCSPHIGHO2_01_FULL_49_9]|uniref:AB hydrolase-1 domain-containing protein n=2 Tax=Bacteria candidate phyla TaxID=1783234 RepID=A0A1F5P3H4_9BACT|nr:MAG: hypothetical protein A2846_03540 [Candidatus Doudnabacteria bacterium RIFCSPHIGHO2_01_FULL_49_9]
MESTRILLLHGWGSSHRYWKKVIDILGKRGVELIVPDMPGFGDNPPPPKPWRGSDYQNWVLKFIAENGLQTPLILAGHSFGGGLAMKLAIDRPELIKKLVLIASARMYVKKSLYKKILSEIAKFGKKFSPFIPFFDIVRKIVYRFVIREMDYARTSGTMKATFINVIKEDLTPQIGRIKTPTLIVWGNKDRATPLEHAYLLNEKIDGSELVVIESAGHAVNLEAPEKVAEAVYNFIK